MTSYSSHYPWADDAVTRLFVLAVICFHSMCADVARTDKDPILKAWLSRMAESNLCSVAHTLLSLLRHGTSQTSTFIGQPSRRLPHGLPGIHSSSVSPDTASSGSISQCSSRIPRSCMHDTSTRAVSAKNKAYFQNFISGQ